MGPREIRRLTRRLHALASKAAGARPHRPLSGPRPGGRRSAGQDRRVHRPPPGAGGPPGRRARPGRALANCPARRGLGRRPRGAPRGRRRSRWRRISRSSRTRDACLPICATDRRNAAPGMNLRMGMDLGRLLRSGAKGMGVGTALFGATAAGLWWQLFRRPLPRTAGEFASAGSRDRVEIARDRWGMPTVRAQTAADLWFGQGFCHGQDRLWQMRRPPPDLLRPGLRDRGAGGPAGRPPDADAWPAPSWRCARRRSSTPTCAPCSTPTAPGSTRRPRRASALPAEFQLLRLEFEPWRPADMLAGGKLLSFGLSTNWERELLRADLVRELGEERAAKIDPTYPKGNPGRAPARARASTATGCGWPSRSGASATQIGLAAAASGSNNWAVSASRSATGGAAARRRPAPAQRHARHLVRGRPRARRAVLPRRLDPGPARDLPGPEQRRRLRLHQRDGRRRGPLRRADRGRELRVRGRAAAARDHRGADRRQWPGPGRAPRGPPHPPRPDRQPGARRGRRAAARAALGRPRRARHLARARRGARAAQRAGAGRAAARRSRCRSRTWSGPTGTDRSATR